MLSRTRDGRRRWSDNDSYFGPFTYAPNKDRRWQMSAVLESDWCDAPYKSTRRVRLTVAGHTIIARLPRFPYRLKNTKYGFSYADGFLQVFHGRESDFGDRDNVWTSFVPWTQWRHVRHSLYDQDGRLFWQEFDRDRIPWDEKYKAKCECPRRTFAFKDFDGEALTASTYVDEREWHFGTGRFKWLGAFRRAKLNRSLEIEFSGETGARKGSWKGGTVGHAIELLKGETHAQAFERYCSEHEMIFGGEVV